MGSSSRASTQTASTTNNVSRNLNLQDTEGVTVGEAGGNVTIISTDHNAFDSATDLARQSLSVGEALGGDALRLSLETTNAVSDLSRYGFDTIADLAGGSINEVGNIANSALSFGDRAFTTVEKALGGVSQAYQDSAAYQKQALTAVQDTQASALDTISDLFSNAFVGVTDFIGNLQGKAQTQLGETVTALNAIAVEQNKSSDQRIAEISENSIKYVLIAVGVLATGAVAFAIFKK